VFNNSTPVDLTCNVINGNYGTITLDNITDDDVEKALKYLKPKRAIGPDGIPQYIYKGCSEFFITPLRYIFNLIIQARRSPYNWTLSSVTPIPITANTNNISDPRPIANMPVPNKIFEKNHFPKNISSTS